MPFSGRDPETRKLLDAVFDAAWVEAEAKLGAGSSLANAAKTKMAITNNLLAAAASGERDPHRLKRLALRGINRID